MGHIGFSGQDRDRKTVEVGGEEWGGTGRRWAMSGVGHGKIYNLPISFLPPRPHPPDPGSTCTSEITGANDFRSTTDCTTIWCQRLIPEQGNECAYSEKICTSNPLQDAACTPVKWLHWWGKGRIGLHPLTKIRAVMEWAEAKMWT